MKSFFKNSVPGRAFVVAIGLMLATHLSAQTYTNLHVFAGGVEGANPVAGLVLSGTTLYGATQTGGISNRGSIFRINTDGTGFTNVYSFTNGIDGVSPYGRLIMAGSTLYGTAGAGGTNGAGTIFAVATNGSFTLLHSLSSTSDGGNPSAGLLLSGNLLYGTAHNGGANDQGSIFVVNINTMAFTNLYNFSLPKQNSLGYFTNQDGVNPMNGLIMVGNTLYGMTESSGTAGWGTVFSFNPATLQLTTIYSFTDGTDGADPQFGYLALVGNALFGTSENALFKIDSAGFSVMHIFDGGDDGSIATGGLTLSGNTLYGATQFGGSQNAGIIYAVNVNGSGFTNVASFTSGVNGAQPFDGLVLSGTTVYGTTFHGDSVNNGTIYRVTGVPLNVGTTPPALTITRSGTNAILTWPNSATNYVLQSTTNLASSSNWLGINGEFLVTNPMAGPEKFYRLSP